MRQFSGLLALSATAILGSNALDASIFTFDALHQSTVLKDSHIPEDAAPLVLARRTQVDDGVRLGETDKETVQALNQFGGTPSPLFGSSEGSKKKGLIILENVGQEGVSNIRSDYWRCLLTSSLSPMDSETLNLLEIDTKDDTRCTFKAGDDGLDLARECISTNPITRDISYITHREVIGKMDSAESRTNKATSTASLRISFKGVAAEELPYFFDSIFASVSANEELTVVVFPDTQSAQASKRNATPRTKTKKDSLARSISKREDEPSVPTTQPVCHNSNSSCTEETKNCSGHGHCYKKAGGECYACKCQPTVQTNDDGTEQKIFWGGPACQKRDISSSFWLTGGVTIVMLAAVGIVIGMMFSVGQEELPGVISAGVGPTKTQK